MWTRNLLVAGALALLGACAGNPAPADLTVGHCNAWDIDGNNYIDSVEFERGFGAVEVFPEWDADQNGYLDNTEWSIVATDPEFFHTFEAWDADASQGIDEAEFVAHAFRVFDEDADGQIGPAECTAGVQAF